MSLLAMLNPLAIEPETVEATIFLVPSFTLWD